MHPDAQPAQPAQTSQTSREDTPHLMRLNVSRLFILRPVATSLLMVALMLVGLLAYKLLPLSALPEVDYPIIQVSTLYPGASPQVVSSGITAPLERQFGQMPGLTHMSSTSSAGASLITLRFSLDMTLDVAEQQVQAALNTGLSLLPNDLPMPPTYSKVNPADTPVVTLAVTSPSLPVTRVHELVESRLAQKLSQVPGVGLVSIAGGKRPAVRIQVNPNALAGIGLSLEDVRSLIGSANVNFPKGSFDGPRRASTLDANDQLSSAQEYAELVLAYKNGAPIRLRDVAQLVDDAENTRLAAWANTQAGVILNIQRQPGANVIDTVNRIELLLPQLKASLPASMDVKVLTNRTLTIRASVDAVKFELMLAIALVVMVIFVFLRNFSATVIPAAAVPLSLLGTFGVMYLCGFSINNLTLMALTISTGFVVDDAIVMIENIDRHLEQGKSPLQAALDGARQIGFTIISLTFSLIAVLIPLLFMADVVGRLFHEFAITLAVAILISALVSLTLTPMMCARLLRHAGAQPEHTRSWWYRASGHALDALVHLYARALRQVLQHRITTWAVFFLTLAFTALLYVWIPKGFFPIQDTGMIQGITQGDQSISFAAMSERQQALAHAILQDPAVASVSSFIGVDGTNPTPNVGRILINLHPKEQRGMHVSQVIERIQQGLEQHPLAGIDLFMQPVQELTLEERVSRTQYQFTLSSPERDSLVQYSRLLVQRLQQRVELNDVSTDLQDQGQQAWLEIDRVNAARWGVSAATIDHILYDAFGQRMISTIFTQSNQYRVVLEVAPEYRIGPEALNHLYVPGTNAQGVRVQVPLSSLVTLTQRPTDLSIQHISQFPAVTLSFNPGSGYALGQAVQAIKEEVQALNMPESIQTSLQGTALAFEASLSSTLWLIVAAIVTMYIVLGVLYESYIHPITILSTLPSAGIGALLALNMAGMELDLIAVIGIILLIGIVKKNAIMMIDFALEAERVQGMAPLQAITQACLLRFRPILMTTLAALLGALPLMLGTGVGSELRNPLGVSMVGGLIVSQLLTLFTTPVIYLTFSDMVRKRVPDHEANLGEQAQPHEPAQGTA